MSAESKGEAYSRRKQQTKGRKGEKVPSDQGPRKMRRRGSVIEVVLVDSMIRQTRRANCERRGEHAKMQGQVMAGHKSVMHWA